MSNQTKKAGWKCKCIICSEIANLERLPTICMIPMTGHSETSKTMETVKILVFSGAAERKDEAQNYRLLGSDGTPPIILQW